MRRRASVPMAREHVRKSCASGLPSVLLSSYISIIYRNTFLYYWKYKDSQVFFVSFLSETEWPRLP